MKKHSIFLLCNTILSSCFVKDKDFIWHFIKNLVEGYERDAKRDFQEAQLAETLKVVTLIYEMFTTHKPRVEQETMLRISGWIKIHMISSARSLCNLL